jgi:glycosyltransferase involved in cell wall biosynthesis
LLFVGRLNAFKSVETLLNAAAFLKQREIDNFELQLVGDGEQRPYLERLAVERGLTKHVRFLGWVDRHKIVENYRQADLFATATTWEGMPNTVLEGMACGLPVVATRASGLEELVRDGVNGYLVEINDAAALADRLAELILNRYERERMGKASRRIAEEEFDWEYITRQYVEIYQRLKKNKGGRPQVTG